MKRNPETWGNPGDLLHALLEGWTIAEISDATLLQMLPEPSAESRRGQGIPSARSSRVSVSERVRGAR